MRWRGFRRRRLWRKGDGLFLGGLAGIIVAALVIHFINVQLRPIMAELASAQVQNAVTTVINRVVSEEVTEGHITYDKIIKLETNEAGAVTALKSDMSEANLLRADILTALVDEVDQVNELPLSIPVGNLTGVDLLSGRGFDIPVTVLTTGTAEAGFENVFSDAGINQTRHQIMLNVSVPVSILMPGYSTRTAVKAHVCVAETVIVGQVPGTYLQLGD
ncbi:MAG: sporulation protein YunB [Clostridia bacterium]|nr:sporulation protein YunB [Clostridia bacterium]